MPTPSNDHYVPALGYDWLTRYYDIVVRVTTRERAFKRALIEQASIEAGSHVLDLACGTGTLAMWIKEKQESANVFGIDGDETILRIAREKMAKAKLEVQYAHGLSTKLPYEDASFDRVVSSLFFHHLRWDDKIITAKEMYRVLKPGGQIHIADWGRPSNALMRALFYLIQLLDGFENTQPHVEGKLVDVFEEAKFSSITCNKTFDTIAGTMVLYRAEKST